MVAIIDTFMYNGEPIVELRLKYLYPYVAQFVIVEARVTITGRAKPELFIEKYAKVFRPYMDKIKFIVIDAFPEMPSDWPVTNRLPYMNAGTEPNWFRERYQRDFAQKYISNTFDEYIVMVCDVDEIPSVDVVKVLPSRYFGLEYPTRFEMKFFYYNFGWVKRGLWYHPFCINDKGASRECASFDAMRTGPSTIYIPNAGWHASFFTGKAEMVSKIENTAHSEIDRSDIKSITHIRECIETGRDILGRSGNEALEPFDISFLPKAFQDFNARIVFLQTYA